MSFCREYWFWRFWTSTCASGCCFMAWRLVLRWYVSFMPCRWLRSLCVVSLVSFFYLSFYRCLAVAGFAFVVCGGFFALSGCFWRRFAFFSISVLIVFFVVVFFAPIFLHFWCPFLYFFLSLNVVCWRFVFLHFRIINRIFSRLDVFIDDDFFSFFCAFSARFCRLYIFPYHWIFFASGFDAFSSLSV